MRPLILLNKLILSNRSLHRQAMHWQMQAGSTIACKKRELQLKSHLQGRRCAAEVTAVLIICISRGPSSSRLGPAALSRPQVWQGPKGVPRPGAYWRSLTCVAQLCLGRPTRITNCRVIGVSVPALKGALRSSSFVGSERIFCSRSV